MKNLIFSFAKPTPSSIVASSRIATFLSETLKTPLVWDSKVSQEPLDVLFLVNGAFAFCKCLQDLYKAVTTAKRIIWVQNDYTIQPPKNVSDAQSPFRKAFTDRKLAGLPDIEFWTTIKPNATHPSSHYVNWNSLTYTPGFVAEPPKKKPLDLFYYGSFRQNRIDNFDAYFVNSKVPVTVSSPSHKFTERYGLLPNVKITPKLESVNFLHDLASHGFGLYIDDKKSQTEFHSPANRFYEMLSAGLPMLFSPSSVVMLKQAGIDVHDYVLPADYSGMTKFLRTRKEIIEEQKELWAEDYRASLKKEVLRIAKKEGVL